MVLTVENAEFAGILTCVISGNHILESLKEGEKGLRQTPNLLGVAIKNVSRTGRNQMRDFQHLSDEKAKSWSERHHYISDVYELPKAPDPDSVGGVTPEPRSYGRDIFNDNELSLAEPAEDYDTKFYNESALSYRFSEQIRQTHRAQREARRRAWVDKAAWVAGWTVAIIVATYCAGVAVQFAVDVVMEWLS